jgi:hypothetical protein
MHRPTRSPVRLDAEHADHVVVLNLRERTSFLQQQLAQPRVADPAMQDLDATSRSSSESHAR